jgi:phosphoribosylglycinamide formyltransferase-1
LERIDLIFDLFLKTEIMNKIAIFASGSGTNAQNIIEYFKDKKGTCVDCLISNNKESLALQRAQNLGIASFVFDRESFYNSDRIRDFLLEREIDLIVLAGFLWLIPTNLVETFKIINIHPALLPKYGGKGMYGMKVHAAVLENKEPQSGITIHFVNEVYDDGKIIFQAKCEVTPDDTPETLASKVHQLEYRYFPEIIEKVLHEIKPDGTKQQSGER